MIFVFEAAPEIISTAFCGSLKTFANIRISSRLAAPSTAGAAMRILRAPLYSPAISVRDARGTIRTANVRPRSFSEYSITRRNIKSRSANGKWRMVGAAGQEQFFDGCEHLKEFQRPASQKSPGYRGLTKPEYKERNDGRNIKHADRRNCSSQGTEQRLGCSDEKTH